MKTPVGLNIILVVVGSTAFYTYVGQLVPQTRVMPPEEVAIEEDLTPREFARVGRKIAEGKGLCLTCHTIGETGALRFPDLGGIATVAEERVENLSALEYLAESLYEPDAYIVPGFTGGMPRINQPPIGLSDQEILAVLAWLESLGGEPTLTPDSEIPYPPERG